MKFLALSTVAGFVLALPAPALAAKKCGTETRQSGGQVFKIEAVGVRCYIAKDVAGEWFVAQQRASNPNRVPVRDQHNRRYRCRITQHATGTDPGYNPYTSVRCTRRYVVIKFKMRS